jgi:hypothetical protein
MKKTLLTLLLAATAVGSYAQGTIQFANIFGTTAARIFLAPIYAPQLGDPSVALHGNSATGVPVGTTVYTGGILNVTGYTLGLFKGDTMIASAAIRTGTAGALPAGTIAVITATVPNADPGTFAQLTVRAWETAAGSYAVASAAGSQFKWGTSEVFTTAKLGGIDPTDGSIVTAPNTIGWTSFNVHGVPEPSTIALGVLGLGSLMLFRRRQAK